MNAISAKSCRACSLSLAQVPEMDAANPLPTVRDLVYAVSVSTDANGCRIAVLHSSSGIQTVGIYITPQVTDVRGEKVISSEGSKTGNPRKVTEDWENERRPNEYQNGVCRGGKSKNWGGIGSQDLGNESCVSIRPRYACLPACWFTFSGPILYPIRESLHL